MHTSKQDKSLKISREEYQKKRMGEITKSYITMFVTDAQKTAITDMFRENKWLCLLHVLSDASVAEVFAKGLGKIFPFDDLVFDDLSMSNFIEDFKIEVNDIASDSDESETESSFETTVETKDDLTLSSERPSVKIEPPDSIEIQAPKIKIEPPDSIEIDAPSNIKREVPDSIEIEAPESIEMEVDSQSSCDHIDHDNSTRTIPVSLQNNTILNFNNKLLSYSQIQQQQLDTGINGQTLRASSVNEVNKATTLGMQSIPLLFGVNGKTYITTVNGKLAVFNTSLKAPVPEGHGQKNNSRGPVSVVNRQVNSLISQQNIALKHVPVVEKQQDNTLSLHNSKSQQNNFQKHQGNVSIPVSSMMFPISVSLPDAKAQQNKSVPALGVKGQKNNTWIIPVPQQSNGVANVKTQQSGLQNVMAHPKTIVATKPVHNVEAHQNSANNPVQNVETPLTNPRTPMAVRIKVDTPVENINRQHTNGNIPLQSSESIPLLEDLLEQKDTAWKNRRKKAQQTSKSPIKTAQSVTTFTWNNKDTGLPLQNVTRPQPVKGIYVCNINDPQTDTEKFLTNKKEKHTDAELSLHTVKGQKTTTGLPVSDEDVEQIKPGIPEPEVKLQETEADIPLENIKRQQHNASMPVPDKMEQQNNAEIPVPDRKRQHPCPQNVKGDEILVSVVEGQQIQEGGNDAVKKRANCPIKLKRADKPTPPIILEERCEETSITQAPKPKVTVILVRKNSSLNKAPEPNSNVDVCSGLKQKVMEPKKLRVIAPKNTEVIEQKYQNVLDKKNVIKLEDIKQKQKTVVRKQKRKKQPITSSRQDNGFPLNQAASVSNTPVTVKEIPASKHSTRIVNVKKRNGGQQQQLVKSSFMCAECQKFYGTELKLMNHLRRCHKASLPELLKCRRKDINFNAKKGNGDEQQQLVKSSFTCDDCQTFYRTELKLIDHLRRCHKASLQEVRKCRRKDINYSGIWKYREEKKDAKLKSSKKYLCESCGCFFLSKYLLEKHCKQKCETEPPKPPVQCVPCNITFKQMSNLIKHFQYLHLRTKCPCCMKDFMGLKGLNFHRKTANNGLCFIQKKFVCKYCGKGFDRHIFLATHLRIHTKEKPHICPVCGHASRLKAYLRKHVLLIHKLTWRQVRDPSRVFTLTENI